MERGWEWQPTCHEPHAKCCTPSGELTSVRLTRRCLEMSLSQNPKTESPIGKHEKPARAFGILPLRAFIERATSEA